jgi:hypothetical protein
MATPSLVGSAIDLDSGGNANTLTNSITVPSGTQLLLILLALRAATAGTFTDGTFNGDALTKLDALSSGTNMRAEWWYLKSPDITTANLVANGDNNSAKGGFAVCLQDVDLVSTFGTFQSGTGTAAGYANWAVTGTAGDLMVDGTMFQDNTDIAMTASPQTEIYEGHITTGTNGANIGGGTQTSDGSDLIGWSWTGSNNYIRTVVPVHGSSGGGPLFRAWMAG